MHVVQYMTTDIKKCFEYVFKAYEKLIEILFFSKPENREWLYGAHCNTWKILGQTKQKTNALFFRHCDQWNNFKISKPTLKMSRVSLMRIHRRNCRTLKDMLTFHIIKRTKQTDFFSWIVNIASLVQSYLNV